MEKECDLCTSEDISRFIDGELSSEQCRSFEHHFSLCTGCSHRIDRYTSLSSAFSRHADQKTMRKHEAADLGHKLEQAVLNSEKKSAGTISGLFGKNIYLKLASIMAVVMIGLFPFGEDLLQGTSGPSAIVNSLDTEYASVMIIETQKEKHTIIWFSEET